MSRRETMRPLGWFRSNAGRAAWLAFFALACQFEFTFGHIHLGSVSAISAALAASADAGGGSADAQFWPARKAPPGAARDFCAVCTNISLANTLVLPAAPAIVPPIPVVRYLLRPLVGNRLASRDGVHFNARAPPT
jgi:hypothetical protein